MRLRSLATAAAVVALAVPLTSCGFSYATERDYTPAGGANSREGVVDLLSAVVVSGAADPINMSTGPNGRRAFAWADADAVSNGYSGPSNTIAPGSRLARINNNSTPYGGPAECRWSVNNCGPNDEPFSFHSGGVNATMGDGSVQFLADSIDGVVVKWMVGAQDGQVVNENL